RMLDGRHRTPEADAEDVRGGGEIQLRDPAGTPQRGPVTCSEDQVIEGADLCEEARDAQLLAYVDRPSRSARSQPLHRVFDACRAARPDDDLRALAQRALRYCETDTGAAADDDDPLIVEVRIRHGPHITLP